MENKSQPKYSIIICAYNMELYLRQCLDSVLAQDSLSSYEILLIDDGSTDGTGAICDEYASAYTCICPVHIEENRGQVYGVNAGLAVARGEYVLFLDSDDLWLPNLLSTLDPLTEELPDMLVFRSETFNEAGLLKVSQQSLFSLPKNGERGVEWMNRVSTWQNSFPYALWFYGWNRAFMERNGFICDTGISYAFDFDLVARGLIAAEKIYGIDTVLHRYRVRTESGSHVATAKKILVCIKDWATIYYRYHYPFAADRYCMEAIQMAYLNDRKKVEESVQFIKDHWDILKDVHHPHSKIVRFLFRIFGIYNGARAYVAGHKVKSWIGRRKTEFYGEGF